MLSGRAKIVTKESFNPFRGFLNFFRNINRIYDEIIDAPCKKSSMFHLAQGTVIIVILELLAYQLHGIFSWLAGRIWLVMGFWYFLGLTYIVIRTLGKDIKERRLFSLVTIGIITFFIFYGVGNLQLLHVNYESVLQVPTGLKALKMPDLNYTGIGFDTPNGTLGYPARHFLLLALPAFWGGPSVSALQLGYALIFFTGLLICYAGFRNLIVKKWNLNPFIAALAVLSFFTFPYLFEFLKNYEQTMLPISYTMHLIGWFLLIIDRLNWNRLLYLMWVGGMLGTGYPPALASWALMLVILSLLWIAYALNKTKYLPAQKISHTSALIGIGSVIIYSLVVGLCTFMIRANQAMELRSLDSLWPILSKGFRIFFLGTPVSFVGILIPVVLVYLLLGMIGRLGIVHFIIAGWVITVVGFSLIMNGYDKPAPEFALNRALMLIPPLVISIIWVCLDWFRKRKLNLRSEYLIGIMILLLSSAVWNFAKPNYEVYKYFNFIKPVRFILADLLQQARNKHIDQMSHPEIVFYSDDPLKTNFADYMNYFFPNARVYVVFQDKIYLNETKKLGRINLENGVIIYADRGKSITTSQLGILGIPGDYQVETFSFMVDNSAYDMQRVIVPANIH
jgi:hypothetical protein